ncbi:MAG TPA: protein kinase [Myxococcota bacterium]|nr:protein kinase [Myxococcota bacterium]
MPEDWKGEKRFGNYVITGRLAVGGMAEIFTANLLGQHGFAKPVVLKRILPHLAEDEKFVNMFIDEAKIASLLQHPNLVQVFDFGDVDGRYYIAMEHVRGVDCARLLRRAARRNMSIPTPLAVHIICEVLRGLDYAHAATDLQGHPLQFVHRDISPSNIFISMSGDVKLGDFGIARTTDRVARTSTGALKGKLGYLSPEQVAGREIDHRSDLFPAAVVLIELITGRPLFARDNELSTLLAIRDARPQGFTRDPLAIPDDLYGVLRKALARNPDERYATAGAFREALLEVNAGAGGAAPLPEELAGFVKRVLGIAPDRDQTPLPPTDVGESERMARSVSASAAGTPSAPARGGSAVEPSSTPAVAEATTASLGRAGAAGSHAAEGGGGDGGAAGGGALREESTPLVDRDLFEVRDAEGHSLGEFVLAGIIERLVTGAISPNHRVRIEPGVWKRVGDVPEFSRHMPDPDLVETDRTPLPDFRGDLARVSMVRVLHRFAEARESGLLIFEHADVRKEVYLVDGRPEFVGSNNPRELLGEFLVERGALRRETLEAALKLLPLHEGRLGATLIHMQALSPVRLFTLLVQQVKAKLTDLFRWRAGSYRYYRGRSCPRDMFPLGLDAYEILADGVRAGVEVAELSAHLEAYQDRTVRRVEGAGTAEVERFRLTPGEHAVLDRVGTTPAKIGALLAAARTKGPESHVDAMRALYLGLECEVLLLAS